MEQQRASLICREEQAPGKASLGWIGGGYTDALHSGLEYVGVLRNIRRGDRVAIKPNLTYPTFRKGVMTNPEAIEAAIALLTDFGAKVTVCEADSGGYNPFSMDEVFSVTGIAACAKRHGAEIVNLSKQECCDIAVKSGSRTLKVPLPRRLVKETDWLISMPVPKIHMNTVVSLSIKNLWGIIPDPTVRLRLHPYLADVVHAVARAMPKPIAVMDGLYGLTRSGPLNGDALELGWLLVADNLYTCDYVAGELMGVPWAQVPHLRRIFEAVGVDWVRKSGANIDIANFRVGEFYLERAWTDYPGLFTFNSRLLAYIGYESFLAHPLHWLLYRFRKPFY